MFALIADVFIILNIYIYENSYYDNENNLDKKLFQNPFTKE